MSTFTIPGRLPALNEYTSANRSNRYGGAQMKRAAEAIVEGGIALCRPEPVAGRVFLTFEWHEPNLRRDCDNVAFAKKFILDALVTAGVIEGDSPRYVTGFRDVFAPPDKVNPRIVVTIDSI